MISKTTISFVRSLHQKKFRKEHKLFIVEGEKMVDELLASDYIIHSLYATEKWINSRLKKSKQLLSIVSDKVLEQLSALKTSNQALAVVHQPEKITGINLEEKYYLALDNISDPGNMGTILRIADWFDIDEIFYSNESVELFNPKVVQATMGSLFRIKAHEVHLEQMLSVNKTKFQLPVIGTVLNGENIFKQKLPSSGIILIGNESRGINIELQKYFTLAVSIPSFNSNLHSAESLNAAVAAGIVCTEIKRQQLFAIT